MSIVPGKFLTLEPEKLAVKFACRVNIIPDREKSVMQGSGHTYL
ncbi:hypothetical protein [Trichodesmium erythraeum]